MLKNLYPDRNPLAEAMVRECSWIILQIKTAHLR